IYSALERLVVRRADCVIVVSHDMARKVVERGISPTKVRVVHNACLLTCENDVPSWKAEAPPLIGVFGRLSPEKGIDLALRVHSLVLQRLHKAQLLIAGEGPECARLQRYSEQLGIASSVCWLGYREALAELYPRLSVLLIPSRSEGLPNVALEAMAYGIPVVAAAVGGLPE